MEIQVVDAVIAVALALIAMALVLAIIRTIGAYWRRRPTPEERATAHIERHAVQRSRRDAELRVRMRNELRIMRRLLREELDDL